MDDFLLKITPIISGLPLHSILLIAVIVLWRKLDSFQKLSIEQAGKVTEALTSYHECVEAQNLLKSQIGQLEREIKDLRNPPEGIREIPF